jgi:uncharacterized NAD-dependent epimerase/dehydratase family protein
MRGERTLILAEGFSHDPHYGKTMRGVLRYRREDVVGILDTARAGDERDGVPVVGTLEEALAHRPEVALVGVATQGGRFPGPWRDVLRACVVAGLSLENGLHERLRDDPELVALARTHGVELRDLRAAPSDLDTPTDEAYAAADGPRVVLTVGSDCAIGKMTVSLELDRAARERGLASAFVPTGQTGIAIAGWGISVDAVVADFIAGAAERLVLEGRRRAGDLLWIEGQGSLSHPAYSGVTLGLLHGSAPHAFVLCHKAGTTEVDGYPGHPLLPLASLVELHERVALPRRPARVACIALNTVDLDEDGAHEAIRSAEAETGLVADDPVRFGALRLLDAVRATVG